MAALNNAVVLLPLAGLSMSVLYPTLNSKGIRCFQESEHGVVAGGILFFPCAGAVVGPLAMAGLIDALGVPRYAFLLAALLNAGLVYTWLHQPTRRVLSALDARECSVAAPVHT